MSVRAKIRITGIVQGVGFRPFVYRLATELWVGGLARGVTLNSSWKRQFDLLIAAGRPLPQS
jgi:hypothetical protein